VGEGTSIAAGLSASAAAALLLGGGLILQALESRKVDPGHGLRLSLLRRLLRRPRWVAGTIIGYLAFPFQVAALACAPLVVVQPVHAFGLLLVLLVGAQVLKERVGAAGMVGVGAIVAGIGLVAWGAPPGDDHAVSQAALFAATIMVVLLAFVPLGLGTRCGKLTLMVCSSLGFAGANLAVKGFTGELTAGHYPLAVAYLALAALGSTVGTLGQMTAFQRYRAVEVVPMTFVIPIFVPLLLANLVLSEHWSAAPSAGLPFALGAFVVLVGTCTLARLRPVVTVAQRAAAG
jgi:drug/metabolite transporter (DMT)-like permease